MFSKQLLTPTIVCLLMLFSAGCKKESTADLAPQITAESSSESIADINAGHRHKVNLGLAGNFSILSKSGITDVYPSVVKGNAGVSPITGAAIHLTCTEVVGTIYTVDAAGPLPCRVTDASMLTTAISNMQTAYVDAAGRAANCLSYSAMLRDTVFKSVGE